MGATYSKTKDPDIMCELHVVLYQSEKWWLAQCLQYDIGAQALDIDDVLYELQRTLIGYALACEKEGIQPFDSLSTAPKTYWDMWSGASIKIEREKEPFRSHLRMPLPNPSIRLARRLAA